MAAVAVLALGAGAAIALYDDEPPAAAPAPVRTTSTTASSRPPSVTADPTTTLPTSTVAVGTPVRVQVPSVGVDAEVLPTAFQNGEIDPPTLGEAYWIADYGAPGVDSDNTVYLLGHSWDNGEAVFNALFDKESQTSRVEPGALVVVSTPAGDVTYEVERTERYPSADVGDPDTDAFADVWAVEPGRLILITCFQTNEGTPADELDNFVVYADVVS